MPLETEDFLLRLEDRALITPLSNRVEYRTCYGIKNSLSVGFGDGGGALSPLELGMQVLYKFGHDNYQPMVQQDRRSLQIVRRSG